MSRQIVRAGAKVLVLGLFITADLCVERGAPSSVGSCALGDRREGGRSKRLVLKHRDLECEDIRAIALSVSGKLRKLCERGRNCVS